MGYVLRWGNKTWLYGAALGLGIGLAILILFKDMLGHVAFWNYYSPMLGYYVLISICQSHYFRRKPEPDMGGLFRQFVSIFGAIVIFFLNQWIMISIFAVPQVSHDYYFNGGIVMAGHFSFIVFGFFIYGFDDFMFKGRLVKWMRNDLVKAVFWYFIIWLVWYFLFYMKGGIGQAYKASEFNGAHLDQLLAISQWTIIMSLLYALVFRDWLPDLQKMLRMKNDFLYGIFLFAAAVAVGSAIAYFCYYVFIPLIWEAPLASGERWHRILYMGTFPLTPAILMGVYTTNFAGTKSTGMRVIKRVALLIPIVLLLYFAFHLVFAEPYLIPNLISPGLLNEDIGIFRHDGGWWHQLDLYFNFTVSIIPLTHHWFCGKWGFMKKVD
ncbi:MAG: hypothetical protein ACMUHB_05145 [Thermoplasmatota archaeon]